MSGLCFGTFRSACVLLLIGVGFVGTFTNDVDTSTVRLSVIVDFPASVCDRPCTSSLFFPPPNNPNNLRLPVFFLCRDATGAAPAEEGSEELVGWGEAGGNWACHLEGEGSGRIGGLPNAIPIGISPEVIDSGVCTLIGIETSCITGKFGLYSGVGADPRTGTWY